MNNNIDTWIDYKPAIAHNKIILIDNKTVITGSFNFTKSAQFKNAENVLVIQDKTLAQKYFLNWQTRLTKSKTSDEYKPPTVGTLSTWRKRNICLVKGALSIMRVRFCVAFTSVNPSEAKPFTTSIVEMCLYLSLVPAALSVVKIDGVIRCKVSKLIELNMFITPLYKLLIHNYNNIITA